MEKHFEELKESIKLLKPFNDNFHPEVWHGTPKRLALPIDLQTPENASLGLMIDISQTDETNITNSATDTYETYGTNPVVDTTLPDCPYVLETNVDPHLTVSKSTNQRHHPRRCVVSGCFDLHQVSRRA